MRAIGIDACRAGWVAVVLDDGTLTAVGAAASLAQLAGAWPGAAAIGVDMPLGLVRRGWRQADQLAAARLGARRSRLFMVPPREAWQAGSYAEALARCRRLTDPPAGFSVQAWGLRAKLNQANGLHTTGLLPLFEVHPEISFAGLGDGMPVAAGKKTWNGQMTRRALLASAGIRLPDQLADAGIRLPGQLADAGTGGGGVAAAGSVAADDILDAAAAAWSAGRIASGQAVCIPDPPQVSDLGHPIAIWY